MRVVFTGGHHTPALAVVAALRKKCRQANVACRLYWFGHKHSMRGDKNVSAEFREVRAKAIPFFDLKAGKFYRTFHPLGWLRLPLGFFQALYLLAKVRPDIIVSFGGYLAVPVVVSGWLLGIPAVTHEQTAVGGLANRLIARFVRKIFISWPQSQEYFPKDKVVLSGNPLRASVFKGDRLFIFPYDRREFPTVYITGGKQGSHVINEAVREALPDLLERFNVIHQCGSATIHDDHHRLSMARGKLPTRLRRGYVVRDYFGEGELGAVFKACDFVVSRGGANIVYELAALGKVAILIPIPWVSAGEQRKNAEILEAAGSALILPQKDLSAAAVIRACAQIEGNLAAYRRRAEKAKGLVRLDAAEKISEEILNIRRL